MKYHVSIGNGHCEVEQFFADTLAEIKTHFRREYPFREEQVNLYVNVRRLMQGNTSHLAYCKPFKLLSFYKVEVAL